MDEKALLNDVLQLLQKATFNGATGEDVLKIAHVIHGFHEWANKYIEAKEVVVENPSN